MHTLTYELASLILEVLGVLGAVVVMAALLRSSGRGQLDLRWLAGAVVGVITVAFAIADVAGAGSALNQARRAGVGARAGLEHCFDEEGVSTRLPFLNWVKARLPAHAVYAMVPYAGQPDGWCTTLVLLPSLPAGPGGNAGWIIAFGTIPPDLQARIARHDPSVQVFAPGFALAKET